VVEIVGKTNFDFMGKRNITFIISGMMVIVGMFAMFQIGWGTANLGIDFAGGTAVQLRFDNPMPIDEARAALSNGGIQEADLQEIVRENKLMIRVKELTTIEEEIADKIVNIFEESFPQNKFVIDSSVEIGPTIGKKLQKDALVAIFISLIGIIMYIAARFEFRFGFAAATATFHDVFVVLGIFYLLDKEITLLVVTALLTLAGYSLTDTVVVFDRIRENLRIRRRQPVDQVINAGINQVLSRTLITTLTVILVLIPLTFFGGEVLHDFSLALLIGVLVGTYSSVFVASPILVVWKGSKGKLLSRT